MLGKGKKIGKNLERVSCMYNVPAARTALKYVAPC